MRTSLRARHVENADLVPHHTYTRWTAPRRCWRELEGWMKLMSKYIRAGSIMGFISGRKKR